MDVLDEFSENDKNYLSSFNDSKLQISRLHNSWELCNKYRRLGKIDKWKFELDTIWDELSSKAKKNNQSKWFILMKIHDFNIRAAQNNKTEKYLALRKKHQFLKWIQDEVGMGIKMKTDDEDDIEE